MTTGLIKAGEVDPKIVEALAEHGASVEIGDAFIEKDGCVYRVSAFEWRHEHYRGHDGKMDVLYVRMEGRNEDGTWRGVGAIRVDDFAHRSQGENPSYMKLYAPVEELEARSVDEMLQLEAEYLKRDEQEAKAGTALTLRHSKEHLEAIRDSIEQKRNRIAVTQRFIERKVRRMQALARGLYEQLKYVTKIIQVGELYLGVNEQIFHLRQGAPAPIDTPVTFHQLVLYMDEEAGDIEWRNGHQGIDFQSVEAFDEWLLRDSHVDIILPEPKGIVMLKISRQRREYSGNPWFDAEMNAKNQKVYALIKNGENVYRIWTTLPVGDRFFPSNEEWALIEAGLQEDVHPLTGEKRTYASGATENQEFGYKRNMAFLQGLLDRTEVFQPMPRLINLFDLDSYEGLIQMIRDDEPSLTSGRVSYKDWKNALNSQIQRGSRVYIAPFKSSHIDIRNRFLIYFAGEYSAPPPPPPGVYTVEEVGNWRLRKDTGDTEPREYRILYNPGDEVYGSWGDYDPHERKKRLSFLLRFYDDFVLNYDGLGIDEIDYHISNRRARRAYLEMLPVLHGIRRALIEERAYEQEFARFLHEKEGYPVDAIREAIEWWKNKVIWKRPIGKDDSKAWRMIKRRLNKQREE